MGSLVIDKAKCKDLGSFILKKEKELKLSCG